MNIIKNKKELKKDKEKIEKHSQKNHIKVFDKSLFIIEKNNNGNIKEFKINNKNHNKSIINEKIINNTINPKINNKSGESIRFQKYKINQYNFEDYGTKMSFINIIKDDKQFSIKRSNKIEKNRKYMQFIRRNSSYKIKLYFPINLFNPFKFIKKNEQKMNKSNYLLNIINFIIIFSLIILSTNKSINLFSILTFNTNRIILYINKKGVHNILNSLYINTPSSVSINDKWQDQIKNNYNLTKEINKITLNFNSITTCENMFREVEMESIEINIDASISNINNMFYNCNYLKNITVSRFAVSNGLKMNSLFYYCTNLISIDLF